MVIAKSIKIECDQSVLKLDIKPQLKLPEDEAFFVLPLMFYSLPSVTQDGLVGTLIMHLPYICKCTYLYCTNVVTCLCTLKGYLGNWVTAYIHT